MNNKYTKSIFGKALLIIIALTFSGYVGIAQVNKKDTSIVSRQKPNWRELNGNKNVTFMQLQSEFNKDWEGKKPKKGVGYKVFKRWEEYMTPRVYPSGDMTLPSNTYSNFIKWEQSNASQNKGAKISAPAATSPWVEIAQGSKASGYDSGVGRIDFVKFDPTNSQIMYICSPDGGLWKSTNGGTTWATNTDFLPIIGCADLAIDNTNTQNMYLATGNRETDRSSIGILKSTDGGTSWTPTSVVFDPKDNITIRRLLIDPTNPQIMMAGTNVGIYRTTDGWATSAKADIGFADFGFTDMEFKPTDPNVVYALSRDFLKSTDKGLTWTVITAGLPPAVVNRGRGLIAVTAHDPAYVYVLFSNTSGGYLGTYRSEDSGTSFTEKSSLGDILPMGTQNLINCDVTSIFNEGQAAHNLALAVSPTDKNHITIGGCNVFKSADGGVTWTLSSYWLGLDVNNPGGQGPADYVHADIQSLDYLPGSGNTVFVTSDGGISKSTNNGTNWSDISNNIHVAQMTSFGQSSLTPYNMVTGLQDIGTLKNSNGVWSVTNGGDGEDGFIDRTNDMTIITSNPNGNFALSLDGGVTKTDITGIPSGYVFFSPIIQDPVTPTLVYAGGRDVLYKSTNVLSTAAATWTALGSPTGSGGIKRFVIAPSNPQIIYALKDNNISKSVDGGMTFTEVLPIGAAQATNLDVSNTDPNKVWVTYSGYEDGYKVFKTVDGGTTWTNISAGLPNIPMNTILYSKGSTTDAVYLGADIGVYYMDNNTSWTPYFTGLARSRVTDLDIYNPTGKLRASTYGRGLWETNIAVTSIITASAGTNGSIAPTGTVGVVSGANKAFTVTPITGYSIDKVLVDNVEVPVGGGNVRASAVLGDPATFTFNNVTTTHSISATFKMDVLPVTLISFEAKANTNNQAQLIWETANEVNFEKFEIEKSADATFFKTMAQVKATGENKYTYLDETPIDNTNYYRLKMIDLDGKFNYSKIIAANATITEPVVVYPNPAKDQITIELNNPNFSVDLIDATGKNRKLLTN
jgi:hypothetical protein